MCRPGSPTTADNPEFWECRYASQEMPWDLGEPAPPFVTFVKKEGSSYPLGRMAVLGSGAGHDAALFGRAGYDVVGFDYAHGAIEQAKDRYGELARFVQADIFDIPQSHWGTFDYVLEHTCFCAILPKRRAEYIQSVLNLLKPNGVLIGLFWAHQEKGGPPYKTDRVELEERFSPWFDIEQWSVPDNSTVSRRGEELLYCFRKKPSLTSIPINE